MTKSQRDSLILKYLYQVKLLARKLHSRCPQVELDDLISVGTIGLIEAIDRFDGTRQIKLNTYTEHRIRGAMLDHLRRIDPLSRNIRTFQKRRDAVLAAFATRGETTTQADVARILGVTERKYVELSLAITAAEPGNAKAAAAKPLRSGRKPASFAQPTARRRRRKWNANRTHFSRPTSEFGANAQSSAVHYWYFLPARGNSLRSANTDRGGHGQRGRPFGHPSRLDEG